MLSEDVHPTQLPHYINKYNKHFFLLLGFWLLLFCFEAENYCLHSEDEIEIAVWHVGFVVVVRVIRMKVELGIKNLHKKKQLWGVKGERKNRRKKERGKATQNSRF